MGQGPRGGNRLQAMEVERTSAVAPGFLPVWDAETTAPPVSDLFASIGARSAAGKAESEGSRGGEEERGYLQMTRFVRIATALSALATVFLVSGASTKY